MIKNPSLNMTLPSETCLPVSIQYTPPPPPQGNWQQTLEDKPRFPQLAQWNVQLSRHAILSLSLGVWKKTNFIFFIFALLRSSKGPTKLVCVMGQTESFLFLVYFSSVVSRSVSSPCNSEHSPSLCLCVLHTEVTPGCGVDLFVFQQSKYRSTACQECLPSCRL